MSASFLEIYNETLRDLLSSSTSTLSHDIKMDPERAGQIYVTNLTPVQVTSEKQVSILFLDSNSFFFCKSAVLGIISVAHIRDTKRL